jgi:hypothetical protein
MQTTTNKALCALVIGGALTVLEASPAPAFELLTKSGACPNGFTYASDPQLTVNVTFVPAPDVFAFTAAVVDVATRINNVGGQNFDYALPFLASNGGYVPGGIFQNGANEIGMANIATAGVAGMGPSLVDLATCLTIEADVFLDTGTTWIWGIPADYGDDYFAAPSSNASGRYGRAVILHELGHTLSLAHSDTSYSFMNYTNRPWSNRARDKMVEPLPDDREALRFLYGNGNAETDIAALVTWFDTTVVNNGAAKGTLFCQPSGGTMLSPGIFDSTCGVDAAGNPGSTTVCPGDTLYTRFALANYGTVNLDVDMELWFSTNTILDVAAGADVMSTTAPATLTVNAQTAARRGIGFAVPTTVAYDTDYYPIINLNTGASLASEESQQNNWIPLLGKIHIDTQANCP